MKNIIILLSFLLFTVELCRTQDKDPQPMIFDSYKALSGTVKTNSELLPADFQANEIILGFQWLGK